MDKNRIHMAIETKHLLKGRRVTVTQDQTKSLGEMSDMVNTLQ